MSLPSAAHGEFLSWSLLLEGTLVAPMWPSLHRTEPWRHTNMWIEAASPAGDAGQCAAPGEARIPCSHPAGCWGSCRAPGSRCSGWRGAVPRCFAQDEPAVAMTTRSHPLPRFLLKSCPHRHRQLLALRLRLGAGQGCGGAWAMPLLVRAKGPGWHAPVAPWLAHLCRCIGDVLGHPKAFWGIPSTTAMP